MQGSTDTSSVKHEINPLVFLRRTEARDAALVVQPFEEGHDLPFIAACEKFQRVFANEFAVAGLE